MRYIPFLALLPLSLSLSLLPASAAETPAVLERSQSRQDFWLQAERLVQEQLNLINRSQRSLSGPDVSLAEATRAQLFLHLGKVERFLNSQYQIPQFLCSNGTASPEVPANLTAPQREVYCSLYASTQQLKPMVRVIERRLPMLAGLAAPDPLSPEDKPPPSLRYNVQLPVRPRYSPVPNFPEPEPPTIGVPTKRPIVDYDEPPFQPAIAPPQQAITTLLAARQQLLSILPAFPESARIIDPGPNPEIIARGTYGLLPLEPQQYAEFLAQPNTGIARLLLAESYHPDPNRLRNRLEPPVLEEFPFASLAESASGMIPRLALEIEDGNIQIPMSGLDYGFIVNLGDVALENLDPTLKNIARFSPQERDLFFNYIPPNQVDALQIDQRRFLTGKAGVGFVPPISPPVSTQVPVELNTTYLVRLIQFQLPEAVLKGEPISREQRRYLPEILKTPSSDVIVAFRPVHRRLDGSYTVLWRLIEQFPDPKIEDLVEYVELE
ncbi:hypothetical protein [Coleofasciculus sp. LEGE 07092]|uniref:hypothetical protein n=1 Tax=Coleofasciculus sp. LEGE 07092 TaxID=2777969 RepID=UPI001881847D|nr:hypothetical protein [Coleofasciculus sp. LEGE 07092]MBE9148178.1 hypothetical protein [Coleofasciculus sp. LEGE 07092]